MREARTYNVAVGREYTTHLNFAEGSLCAVWDRRREQKTKRKAKKEEKGRKKAEKRQMKSAAPGLPAWSPTAVLPRLEPA